MSDQSMRRADDLITELVETVETARTVPMSASCVIPRERVLDLLDELREVLPADIAQAKVVMDAQEEMLSSARATETAATRNAETLMQSVLADSAAASDKLIAEGRQIAHALVADAQAEASAMIAAARREHSELVSTTAIHASAAQQAAAIRGEAEQFDAQTRDAAGAHAQAAHAQASAEAERLRAESENYAEQTLAELADVLRRVSGTVEGGRERLRSRRADQSVPE